MKEDKKLNKSTIEKMKKKKAEKIDSKETIRKDGQGSN